MSDKVGGKYKPGEKDGSFDFSSSDSEDEFLGEDDEFPFPLGEDTEEEEEEEEPMILELGPDESYSPEDDKRRLIKKIDAKKEFQFSINYFVHPDLVPYFWASLHQYYQELMELFLVSDGWMLEDFLRVAERKKLHMVFRCAYTRKGNAQQKEGHFRLVFSMLLDNAKFQWLAPWKRRNTSGLSICMKRQVGGFFLLYYLLFKQPEPPEGILSSEKQKLAIDPDDSRAMRFFLNDLEKLDDEGKGKELKKEVKLAFLKLHHKGYLRKTILKNEYSLDTPFLFLNGAKNDPRISYFGLQKDIRDKLLYLTFQGIGNTTFKKMLQVSQVLVNASDAPPKKRQKKTNKTNSPSKEAPASKPVTFQTQLRQRLDEQFKVFHDKYHTPWLEELTEEVEKLGRTSEEAGSSNRSSPVKEPSTKNEQRRTNTNVFPPPRKVEWSVEDVKALRSERDIAVIAFRVIEILKFVTPANPLSVSRLINEIKADHTQQGLIKKHYEKELGGFKSRLLSDSRISRMSSKGNHRCRMNAENKSWMEYLTDKTKQLTTAADTGCSPVELLAKLKTHDVIAIEPKLVFKPSQNPDTCSYVLGDGEYEFDRDPEEPKEDQSQIQSASVPSKQDFGCSSSSQDMPDLLRFWEEFPTEGDHQGQGQEEPPVMYINTGVEHHSSSESVEPQYHGTPRFILPHSMPTLQLVTFDREDPQKITPDSDDSEAPHSSASCRTSRSPTTSSPPRDQKAHQDLPVIATTVATADPDHSSSLRRSLRQRSKK